MCAALRMGRDGFRESRSHGCRLRRARCRWGCGTRFTFVPVYMAPGSRYDFAVIEGALCFVAGPEHRTPTAAFDAWDWERDKRIDDKAAAHIAAQAEPGAKTEARTGAEDETPRPGLPSRSTVRRWWARLGQRSSWLEVTLAALRERGAGDCAPAPVPGASGPAALLLALMALGKVLARAVGAVADAPTLALGFWFVEASLGQRCRAGPWLFDSAPRAKPPSSALTSGRPRRYRRARPSPPGRRAANRRRPHERPVLQGRGPR